MSLDWQNIIALVVVVVAAIYLARRSWQTLLRKGSRCGGCAGCSSQKATSQAVVTIDLAARPSSR
jgi:hypothetical protein